MMAYLHPEVEKFIPISPKLECFLIRSEEAQRFDCTVILRAGNICDGNMLYQRLQTLLTQDGNDDVSPFCIGINACCALRRFQVSQERVSLVLSAC